ncbi:MAG: hypothetical protein ABF257_09065 [Polaribacter sp.]
MVYTKRNSTHGRLNYTEVIEDLIDGHKERTTHYWYNFSTNDWCASEQVIKRI